MLKNRVVLLCVGLAICLINFSPAREAQEITCTGKVVNAEGLPVERASVSVYDQPRRLWFHNVTDEKGVGRVRLYPGTHRMSGVNKQGYAVARQEKTITIEQGRTNRVARQLTRQPKTAGVVRDEQGRPLEGVELKIYPMGRQNVRSDSQGRFEISWDPGRWSMRDDIIFCLVARHLPRNLAAIEEIDQETKTLDVKLKRGITLTGRIVDPDGKGIAGAEARVRLRVSGWGSPPSNSRTQTDKDGNFEIDTIPSGYQYTISTSADGYGGRDLNAYTDDAVDHRLDVGTATLAVANLSLSGRIVDARGKPVADASVEGYGIDQPNCRTQSDAEGYFTLDGFCEGIVWVMVVVRRGGKRLSAFVRTDAGAASIKIPIHQRQKGYSASYYIPGLTDEQIIRGNQRAIAGVALDERGAPVAGVPVSVYWHQRKKEDGRLSWLYTTRTNLSDITNEQGRFAIAIKEDGKYNLSFSPGKHAAMIVYDVPSGKRDLKVTLPDGGTLAGRLLRLIKGRRVPVPRAEVKMQQADRFSYTHLGLDRDRTTLTDEQGRFRFEHVRTKIRPRVSKSDKQWTHILRWWKISHAGTSKTVAFDDGTTIENFELVVRPDPTSAGALLGAVLPEFDDIKIDLPADFTVGRMVVVCFFDMDQRPSRHCVTQLAKRAEQLEEKGVTIVAVQTPKLDEDRLGEWVNKNVPLRIGMAQGDKDEIRSIWGVRSLPWLILTDADHVVRAEGFGPSELDDKIKAVEGP